jgi:thiol:disulfide interchange protein DsbG
MPAGHMPGSSRAGQLVTALVILYLSLAASLAPAEAGEQAADAALWSRLQRAAWVEQGDPHGQHLIYVIADADCSFCHDLWLSLQPHYQRGLKVRFVMVGVISEGSPGKAAAILQAPKPSVALDQNEKGWAKLPDDLGGGIKPLTSPAPNTLAAIKANGRLMHDLGVQGTPAIVYRSADQKVHVMQSALSEEKLSSILATASPG